MACVTTAKETIMKTKINTLVRLDSNNDIILFFPTLPARAGFIDCWQWVGQHCEAAIEYAKECRNIKDDDLANAAIKTYVDCYPLDSNVEYVLVKRINSHID